MSKYKDSYREAVDIAKEAIKAAKFFKLQAFAYEQGEKTYTARIRELENDNLRLKKQDDDNIRLLDSYMHQINELKEKAEHPISSHPTRHYDIMHKPHWIKAREGKTYKFECSRCHTDAYCVHYDDNKETVCNYKFCPHCGVRMEIDL